MLKDKVESLHHCCDDCGQGELCPYEKSDFLSSKLLVQYYVLTSGGSRQKATY